MCGNLDRLESVVSNVTTFPAWSSDNVPVIKGELLSTGMSHVVLSDTTAEFSTEKEFQYNLKGVFIRALAEARSRNPGTELAQYIEAYIMVQVCVTLYLLCPSRPEADLRFVLVQCPLGQCAGFHAV